GADGPASRRYATTGKQHRQTPHDQRNAATRHWSPHPDSISGGQRCASSIVPLAAPRRNDACRATTALSQPFQRRAPRGGPSVGMSGSGATGWAGREAVNFWWSASSAAIFGPSSIASSQIWEETEMSNWYRKRAISAANSSRRVRAVSRSFFGAILATLPARS